METLNLGILAHVDAGKTTLTERLLHAAGVIDEVGRVDDGTTQTDSLALERERGITIKSAVASFVVDGVTVNLLDTPGHPDFIAEVERVLGVLDGAVLAVSAVEGVQSQTLLLFRALRRLGVPTVFFVNKIDRVGADDERVLAEIATRLDATVVAMGTPREIGTKGVSVVARDLGDPTVVDQVIEAIADADPELASRYLNGAPITADALARALVEQTAAVRVHPVFFGAALTGVGVTELLGAIPTLLPVAGGDQTGDARGTVFKIERGPTGEKIAMVRMFAGTLRTRDRLHLGGDGTGAQTVTAIDVVQSGGARREPAVHAGQIAKVHGLGSARIGDTFGMVDTDVDEGAFPLPTLETAVVPRRPADKRAVFDALADLAEQDPLINLRQDDARQELYLSLYGEVQKEVVAQTLAAEYGLDIGFRPTTPVCIERPVGIGSAIEHIPRGRTPSHPFLATVGLTVSPLSTGSGVHFELDVGVKSVPIHVFDSLDIFRDVMDRAVRDTLLQGLHGWEVTDCRVVMTECDYQAPPRKWPGTTLSDYRDLTPLVLMAALKRGGTEVCEPVLDLHLEFPVDVVGSIMSVLHDVGAHPGAPSTRGTTCTLDGVVRVARVHELQSRLPDLTRGEGVLETALAGFRPVEGPPPSRPRTDRNPLDRVDYLRRINRGPG